MAILPGKRLGPYEILSAIGAGGMGEVYRARDTRLDRIVAIKVLPAHLADRSELRERFEREARTIASLNHPHICVLHDIGRQDGTDFLVMEYLEGETLAARLLKGPLPLEHVLQYAIEISDALDKAHRKGVTHRDLKPGNIMLTKSSSKLLDFGLAKLRQDVAPATPLSKLPTAQDNLTAKGTILGTLQYIAPEQLEGKEVDARTDIFAFGAVVYEMATGKKCFEGKSQASVISAIMSSDPPSMSSLQPMTPPALDRVVKKCLGKDPENRWQSARDVTDELEWIVEGGAAATPAPTAERRLQNRFAWAVAAVALLAAALIAVIHFREAAPEARTTRLSVLLPEKFNLSSPPEISPDARYLAFAGQDATGQTVLWIRPLDSPAAQALPGTSGATQPFWSPNSRSLGFFADGKLKKIDIAGGPPLSLCDTQFPFGGTWSKDGVILFGQITGTLMRVSAAGGSATPQTVPSPSIAGGYNHWPWFLPDGNHFLYLSTVVTTNTIYLGSLDSHETRRLFLASGNVEYIPPGYLLFTRDRILMAQGFDVKKLQLVGDEFPVAEQLRERPNLESSFSASPNGVLAYVTGSSSPNHFVWLDRAGREARAPSGPVQAGSSQHFSLSPDENRVAIDQTGGGETSDIWMLELTRGNISRFTFEPSNLNSAWSPDGNRLAFLSSRAGTAAIYQKAASGAAKDELLTTVSGVNSGPTDWSPDGRFLLYEQSGEKTGFDLWLLPLFGDRKPMPFLQTQFDEGQGRFSPDGHWVAYASTESGRPEVYVQTFPASGGKWQISNGGGMLPLWRRDGKELFYVVPAVGRLMSVEVKTSPQFEASAPKFLFQAPFALTHQMDAGNHYAVSTDGQRFLLNLPMQENASSPITVVLNWTAGLKK
jgi:serine/threonine protein kinase